MAFLNREYRPDLAVGIEFNTLGGAAKFLAPRLFPRFAVREMGGTIAAAQVIQASGVKDRTQGQALTGTRVASVDVTYSCVHYEGRSLLDDKEIKQHGGVDAAVKAGAVVSGWRAGGEYEKDAAAKVFTATRYAAATAINASAPFDALISAATDVKHYGEPSPVCSETWLRQFVKNPVVMDVLVDLYGHRIIAGVMSGAEDALLAVGAAFAIKRILVGDDAFWAVGAGTGTDYSDAAAVVGLREEAMRTDPLLTAKALPCYGFAPTFLPDEASTLEFPFEIMTGYLDATKDSYVDATLYANVVEANAAAAKLVKLPA
jgi:hypothetical protein